MRFQCYHPFSVDGCLFLFCCIFMHLYFASLLHEADLIRYNVCILVHPSGCCKIMFMAISLYNACAVIHELIFK